MKVRLIVLFVLSAAILHAQMPEKMSYQAVVRNSAGDLVKNTQIGMRISILQGSATGTAVYTETQTPTTNANGLVSIQFGGGAGFNAIDWSSGVYFLKTETDINGGTNYSITGTSQLLSVPYALYAKTAETIPYSQITGAPPVNQPPTCSITAPANNATVNYGSNIQVTASDTDGTIAEVQLFVDNKFFDSKIYNPCNFTANLPLGVHTLTAIARDDKGAATKSTAINIIVNAVVGMAYQGGIVAYVDATGQHGLIAAPYDQSAGIQWYNGSISTTNVTGTAIGTGQSNTTAIVVAQGAGSYAAQLCNDLVLNGYDDWFLPSKDELNQLYINKNLIGGFAANFYWSSSESTSGNAWEQSFSNGSMGGYYKGATYRVRAVRAF